MAESFAFGSVAFYTRDTNRLRQREALKRRERALRLKQQQEHQLGGESVPEEEPIPSEREEALTLTLPERIDETKRAVCSPGPKRWAYKNLYGASIAFMLVFSAFIGLQNLQSSLNPTLGVISLAVTYGFYFLVGFVTPGIVRLLSTKYALLFGFLCHLVYIASNFYPELYTLIPSSILLGIGSGPVWAGLSTHLAKTAITLAPHVMESIEIVISRFTGIFFFIFQLTQIVGNLISSLVLFPYDAIGPAENETLPDPNICNNTEAQNTSPTLKYVLLSIYIFLDIIGIVVLLIFVDRVSSDSLDDSSMKKKNKVRQYCSEPFVELLKVLISWKMLLLGPLSLYNGMELSFAYGSFTQVFISECVGVSNVGFVLIVLGFFSATTSFVYGKIVKYVPRVILTTIAAVVNLFFLLFLQFWPRQPSFALIFLFAIGWGIADGVWNTMSASLVGILFPTRQEAAYSAFRIWMSLGFAIGFAIAELKAISDRLWIMLAVLLFSFTLYVFLEFFNSKFGARCCKSTPDRDDGSMTMELDDSLNLIEGMLDGDGLNILKSKTDSNVMSPTEEGGEYTLYAEQVPSEPPVRSATYAEEDLQGKKQQRSNKTIN